VKRQFGFPIVYDCHDLLGGFAAVSKDILAAEPALFENADLVCFTSQWLLDDAVRQRPAIAGKSLVVRNAVNPLDFSGAGPAAMPVKPTIGYAGSLDFWFDIEAIRQAALLHPDWNFVLIGRVEFARILELKALPNVSFEGEVPYAGLPARMYVFDVAMIPFVRMPLTLATNPLKLYEYLCLGVPIVSTRLPEVEAFHDLVYLAEGTADFVRQLELAVAERDPDRRARRRAAGGNNSWRARCEQLAQRFESLPLMARP
jgi:O-antigen biosynthesis protein